ncbi:MAG: hypothetical protein JST20_09170 [Bacteroidetes bacterium]|nr:hypothetical protein [Bacteroidota bacterium]
MKLGILNETVILIDTDFLNERINHNLTFYQKLYPKKNFEKIKLADLLYKFAINARVEEAGHNVDILFAYTLDNSILTHCDPDNVFNFIDVKQVQMETDKGTFIIRSFFGDEDETCSEHFVIMLMKVINSPSVSRIIMVADNSDLNSELEILNEQNERSLFMLKKYHDSEIEVPIKYVNIDYPIAYALGLRKYEL